MLSTNNILNFHINYAFFSTILNLRGQILANPILTDTYHNIVYIFSLSHMACNFGFLVVLKSILWLFWAIECTWGLPTAPENLLSGYLKRYLKYVFNDFSKNFSNNIILIWFVSFYLIKHLRNYKYLMEIHFFHIDLQTLQLFVYFFHLAFALQ